MVAVEDAGGGSGGGGRRLMRSLTAAAAVFLAAAPATAADEDAQLWTTAIATGPVADDLAAWVEVQTRFGDDVSRLSQSKVRVALGYRFTDALTIYGGYAYVTSHLAGRVDTTENRLWQQAGYAIVREGPVRVNGRTRLEQRFLNTGSDTGWRLRQQLRFAIPLAVGGGPSLVASGEALFALNDTDWGARAGLDQLRGFAGVNVPLGRKQAVEVGYLNQYVHREGARDQVNHVGVVTLSHRF